MPAYSTKTSALGVQSIPTSALEHSRRWKFSALYPPPQENPCSGALAPAHGRSFPQHFLYVSLSFAASTIYDSHILIPIPSFPQHHKHPPKLHRHASSTLLCPRSFAPQGLCSRASAAPSCDHHGCSSSATRSQCHGSSSAGPRTVWPDGQHCCVCCSLFFVFAGCLLGSSENLSKFGRL